MIDLRKSSRFQRDEETEDKLPYREHEPQNEELFNDVKVNDNAGLAAVNTGYIYSGKLSRKERKKLLKYISKRMDENEDDGVYSCIPFGIVGGILSLVFDTWLFITIAIIIAALLFGSTCEKREKKYKKMKKAVKDDLYTIEVHRAYGKTVTDDTEFPVLSLFSKNRKNYWIVLENGISALCLNDVQYDAIIDNSEIKVISINNGEYRFVLPT